MRPVPSGGDSRHDGPVGGGPQAPGLHVVPDGGTPFDPALQLLDQQEQLAEEVGGLVVELSHKLERYMAIEIMLATGESARADINEAVEWMRGTIEDLVATVVGIEPNTLESVADPISS